MAVHLRVSLFFGFLEPRCPWRAAEDYDAAEDWSERWRRRLEALGRDPDEATPAEVGCDFERSGPWWISAPGSLVSGSEAEAAPIEHAFRVQPEWAKQLRAFCEVMQIPLREPGWCVASSVR